MHQEEQEKGITESWGKGVKAGKTCVARLLRPCPPTMEGDQPTGEPARQVRWHGLTVLLALCIPTGCSVLSTTRAFTPSMKGSNGSSSIFCTLLSLEF